jgi:peptide/nickel transport system permease protein
MIAGVLVIAAILCMTAFPRVFTRYLPDDQNAGGQMTAPSSRHIMGTDNLSRDVWARVVYGAQTILGVAVAAALLSAIIGIPLGLMSGFAGGVFDRILSLVMDSLYSFPGLILAIAFAAMLGPGVINITLSVAVVYIPTYFRLVRGQTLSIKEEVYVEAARAIGAGRATILSRYIFPNVIATVVVIFSLNIADAILTEASLSYIGLGLPAGLPDWGMDLSMGKKFLPSGIWWMITFPGLMIMLLALGFTMLGEGLAEILNPRLLER